MIKNREKLDKFYRKLTAQEQLSHKQAIAIYEAVSLGAISSENMLEGLDVDLRIARAINGLKQ